MKVAVPKGGGRGNGWARIAWCSDNALCLSVDNLFALVMTPLFFSFFVPSSDYFTAAGVHEKDESFRTVCS